MELDAEDTLKHCRQCFSLPDGIVYLDGNSLGALPCAVPARIARSVEEEWGQGLIRSWNTAGWIDLPREVAGKIAWLIGAAPDCVAVTDSTSVNLFKVLAAALSLRPGRASFLSERDNFPTDLYIAEGLNRLLGGDRRLALAGSPEEIADRIDADTAVLMLTHVNYRTGRMHDLAALTRRAHEAGALVVWDLAHSAGAVELQIEAAGVDFAVGCGYKYLNGGPGAPAFLYAARRHLKHAAQPLSGWFSHREPFAFTPGYAPAEDIARFQTGTPPVLALAALDGALDAWAGVTISEARRKSVALTGMFIEVVEALCDGHGLELVTPRQADLRGSQVSFAVRQDGFAIMQALIERGVIGDYRAPDIIRFGFAPLYNRFLDAVLAAETLAAVLSEGIWRHPRFRRRARVT
jgi:kynureninase